MTREDIASLALQLLGIYVLAQVFLTLPMISAVIRQQGDLLSGANTLNGAVVLASQILPVGVVIVGSLGIIIRADRVAAFLISREHNGSNESFSRQDALTVGLSLIGASLFARGLPDLAKLATLASMESDNFLLGPPQFRGEVAEIIAQLAVGLALFCGARSIAAAWSWLRQLGRQR